MNGSDILVLIDDGTGLQVVGSQRDVTFDETNAEIDVSSKDGRAKRVLYGRYSASVSLDALYVPTDEAYQMLKAAMRNATMVTVIREEEDVYLESAEAMVASLSEKGPDQAEATVSCSLTIDGEWIAGT